MSEITASEAIEQLEFELSHPEAESTNHEPVAAITDDEERRKFLDWLVAWLEGE